MPIHVYRSDDRERVLQAELGFASTIALAPAFDQLRQESGIEISATGDGSRTNIDGGEGGSDMNRDEVFRSFLGQFVRADRQDRFIKLASGGRRTLGKLSEQMHHPEKWLDISMCEKLKLSTAGDYLSPVREKLADFASQSSAVLVAGEDELRAYNAECLDLLDANQGVVAFGPRCAAVVFGEYATYWCHLSGR